MYLPPNYEETINEGKLKEILVYNGLASWNLKQGLIFILFTRVTVKFSWNTSNIIKKLFLDLQRRVKKTQV